MSNLSDFFSGNSIKSVQRGSSSFSCKSQSSWPGDPQAEPSYNLDISISPITDLSKTILLMTGDIPSLYSSGVISNFATVSLINTTTVRVSVHNGMYSAMSSIVMSYYFTWQVIEFN